MDFWVLYLKNKGYSLVYDLEFIDGAFKGKVKFHKESISDPASLTRNWPWFHRCSVYSWICSFWSASQILLLWNTAVWNSMNFIIRQGSKKRSWLALACKCYTSSPSISTQHMLHYCKSVLDLRKSHYCSMINMETNSFS